MKNTTENWSRRRFLASMAAVGAVQLAAPASAFLGVVSNELKLGFDNFSVRAFDWKAPRLVEYAASLGVDTLLLSDLDVYESLEADYLQKIRVQAEQAGVEVQVGTGSICGTSKSYNAEKWGDAEEHARLLIRTAKQLGASVARCYLGSRRDRDGDGGIYRHIDQMVEVLKAVKSEANDANVKIAVENHAGDMQAWELVSLIEQAGKDFVGATMDPGNAAWTVEDPMVNLELLGPYALTTGIRDSVVWETENGATAMWANMGQGLVDWPVYVDRFRELCPAAPFVLEIISYKWPYQMPYLTPEFWNNFPRARAAEFARFVAFARRGSEYKIPAGRPTGEANIATEQAQQKYDLEQSLNYCRDVLKVGVKS